MALDEFEIIERYFAGLTPARADVAVGIGDDAAVLRAPSGQEIAATTDTLVAGVHFAPDADPFDVGYKALAVNLSDLAAMGAEPRWATLALTLPVADPGWLRPFADGFSALARAFDVGLVGGNLARGPLNITVHALGCVPERAALRRTGAAPGDRIYVTGELGSAAFACAALAGRGFAPDRVPPACFERLRRPEPRVRAGMALRGTASAAIDVSDGVYGDLGHVARASAVAASLRLESLPLCPALAALPDVEERWRLALAGGDDYELCFTAPPARGERVEDAMRAIGLRVTAIGEVTAGAGVRCLRADGSEYLPPSSGYRHFRGGADPDPSAPGRAAPAARHGNA